MNQITLLRHGEPATKGLFCAHADEPLSKKGWQQLIEATHNQQWDHILSSPFKRCSKFAYYLAEETQTPINIINDLKEMDFGAWVGQTTDYLWSHESEKFQQLWQSPESFIAPNGESMLAFNQRVNQAWDQLITDYSGKNILLVVHAGVIYSVLARLLDLSPEGVLNFEIAHACKVTINVYADGNMTIPL